MLDWLRRSLWDVVPRDQRDTAAALRRRQVVTLVVVIVGAAGWRTPCASNRAVRLFYLATLLLPIVWVVGAFSSGRLHLGRRISSSSEAHRPWLAPSCWACCWPASSCVGGLVVREIEPLQRYVRSVLEYADEGSVPLLLLITVVNGIAEELFFRGAAYAAIPRHPVVWTTLPYVLATLATGNVMLAFAAILLGTVCGLQRRASGGVLAPILTHITWSVDAAAGATAPLRLRPSARPAHGVRPPGRSAARRARRRGSRYR